MLLTHFTSSSKAQDAFCNLGEWAGGQVGGWPLFTEYTILDSSRTTGADPGFGKGGFTNSESKVILEGMVLNFSLYHYVQCVTVHCLLGV